MQTIRRVHHLVHHWADRLPLSCRRLYGMVLSGLLLLVETEWTGVLSRLRLLDSWVARGLTQMLVATLTLELATSSGDSDFDRSVLLYRSVAGASRAALHGCKVVVGLVICIMPQGVQDPVYFCCTSAT